MYQLFTHVKLGSNIAVKNVLQVYVTTTTIFYAISVKEVRTSHALTGARVPCDITILALRLSNIM